MKPGDKQSLRVNVRCGLPEELSDVTLSKQDSLDRTHGLSARLFSLYLNSEAGLIGGTEVARASALARRCHSRAHSIKTDH